MAGQSSQDLFAQAVDLFSQRVNDYASGIAQRLGQPMSGSQLNKDQVLQRWNFSPLGDTQTADAQYHQLVAQGTPPGQALDQVYPFRKMLITGPDLKSQIDTANQIAQWNAEANGQPAPSPDPQNLPLLQWASSLSGPSNAQPAPAPVVPPVPGGGLNPTPMPAPLPVQGAPGLSSPAPGQMPPISPVPGVS